MNLKRYSLLVLLVICTFSLLADNKGSAQDRALSFFERPWAKAHPEYIAYLKEELEGQEHWIGLYELDPPYNFENFIGEQEKVSAEARAHPPALFTDDFKIETLLIAQNMVPGIEVHHNYINKKESLFPADIVVIFDYDLDDEYITPYLKLHIRHDQYSWEAANQLWDENQKKWLKAFIHLLSEYRARQEDGDLDHRDILIAGDNYFVSSITIQAYYNYRMASGKWVYRAMGAYGIRSDIFEGNEAKFLRRVRTEYW